MKYIFAMGLYRSGTNFLQQLVDNNFEGNNENIKKYLLEKKLYKHCLHDTWYNKIPNNVIPIIIFKKPHQWIDSLVRQSYDLELYYDVAYEEDHTPILLKYCNPKWEEFNTSITCSVEKLCLFYNCYFNYWLNKNPTFIYHGDIAFNYNYYLANFETKYNLIRKHKDFIGPGEVDGSRPFDNVVKNYYLNDKTDNLTSTQLSVIDSLIDKSIIKKLSEFMDAK